MQIESSAESIDLPDQSIDRLLCSFVLHEVDNLNQVFSEFKRILKPGSKMLLLEWEKKETASGPPVHERIDAPTLSEELDKYGWEGQHIQLNQDQYAFLVIV
ncbi:MAG: methyltransferase domain-containing protein [Alicyclobacillus sp.]|nr:methyltransferase domain-containing protein [Alicyclobacillus sp.]